MLDDRTSAEYQQWRQDVRNRDGNSCRRCGFDTNLEVHHIKPLVKYPEFVTELDNGLTLCGNCHSLLKGREEITDLLKFIEESPYSRDEQIVERLMVMMSKQLKVLNDKFIEWTRRKAEAPKENDRLTEPKHIQAEMLRLEAEEKFREADEAVEKRRLEAEEKRQREAEEQQRRKVEEKLKTTKQQTSIRDFQEGENGHLSDNRASTQVKKRKNLGKPKSSHRKDLKQTNKAGTEQRSNASGRWKYRREVGRNRSKAKAAQRRRTDATAPKQDAAALEKLKLLAEKGDSTAQFSLGIKHRRSRNDGEAAKWYRRAAQQGDAAAQYNLGWMYEYGEGVVKDKWEAVKWYRRAAQQGNAAAQYNLGWMYQHGRGVPQNDAEAVKWYRKAAQQGYSAAQDNLDWMYQNGRGVEQI